MRMRDQIIQVLRGAKPMLDSHGVAYLRLFGSFARDEGREDSDVDCSSNSAARSGCSISSASNENSAPRLDEGRARDTCGAQAAVA